MQTAFFSELGIRNMIYDIGLVGYIVSRMSSISLLGVFGGELRLQTWYF